MPCALCGDIIPTEITRCPACGAWARRRDFRAVGVALFMMLGFNAFIALGSGVGLLRLAGPLRSATLTGYDPVATGRELALFDGVLLVGLVMAGITGLLYLGWLWRAYDQSSGPHRHRHRWVLLGWLPPAALWVPPRLVYDIWVGSLAEDRARTLGERGRVRTPGRHSAAAVVTAWWGTVLLGLVLSRVFAGGGAQTLDEARLSVATGVAATACHALAATLCMATVFQITRLQIAR